MQYLIKKDQFLIQKLNLSLQQIVSLHILSMNSYDLFEYSKRIVLSNPGLVLLNQNKLTHGLNEDNLESPNSANLTDSLFDHLHEQIDALRCDKAKKRFLKHVLENYLDDDLYLKQDEFLKKYSSFKYFDWLRYFKRIKPVGVAARSIQERFKQQLESKGLQNTNAYKVIDECWKYFIHKQYDKISALLKVNRQDVQESLEIIAKYCRSKIFTTANPKCTQIFIKAPDLILGSDHSLYLNEEGLPRIAVDSNLLSLLKTSVDSETKHYIQTLANHAQNLTNTIAKRNQTLLLIVQTVFDLHKQHLAVGCQKRLTLKEISKHVNFCPSTVSRALNRKTILTHDGIKMVVDFLKPLTYHPA